jgi:hypothetical protein
LTQQIHGVDPFENDARMRLRRLPLMIPLWWHSLEVMELMMASMRVNWDWSTLAGGLLHAGEGTDGGADRGSPRRRSRRRRGLFWRRPRPRSVEFFFGAFEQAGDVADAESAEPVSIQFRFLR